MRETLLGKALTELSEYEEPEFQMKEDKEYVEDEIKDAEKEFQLKQVKERKERVLISSEIAKLALEENIIDIAFEGATLAVKDEWDF